MQQLPEALAPLASYQQFVLGYKVPRVDGKVDKIPVNPGTLKAANAHNPNNWLSADDALARLQTLPANFHIGFVLTEQDPFYFVDIDHCLQPDNQWSPIVHELIQRLPGAAVEVSSSGDGIHIIGMTTPMVPHVCNYKTPDMDIEFYTKSRVITLTGDRTSGSVNTDSSAAIADIARQYFPPSAAITGAEWTTEPVAAWDGPNDSELILKRAMASKSVASVFGARASFKDLWKRNIEVLGDVYPDPAPNRDYDYNVADAALAQHLAFWTGNNCQMIYDLMFLSALVREKWDREKYVKDTILKAVCLQTTFYNQPAPLAVTPESPLVKQSPTTVIGLQYFGVTNQIEFFKGCVYVQSQNRIFTPTGTLLKQDTFNAWYGGYTFQMSTETPDKPTRKAWEAFTESQVLRWPMAHNTCFRPQLKTSEIVEEEGLKLVNTYVPVNIRRVQGDASPFLNHLAKMLPVKNDRDIILAYMAACVQHAGVKFQWAPLIQGVEGNGKTTMITTCIAHAVGHRYTHMPQAKDISNVFNAWLVNKIFIGVEDIYIADTRQDVIEALKPMITAGCGIGIQGKGADQVTRDICANFVFNANFKDAIRKTRNDRRFGIFYTAQQDVADLARDGMDGDYFQKLNRWLSGDGFAIITELLNTHVIPDELNPALGHRAPVTSSTEEALLAGLGSVEQEILEAIDSGKQGFKGGWVSSIALNTLLDDIRKQQQIPLNRRRDILKTLGYDWHPALKNGRVNNYILCDQGKPRLFIRNDHIHRNLTTGAEVSRVYEIAQTRNENLVCSVDNLNNNV